MISFVEEMDKLAAEIAKAANMAAIDLPSKIDAFKALVPYYAQQMKRGKPDDDTDLNTFEAFQAQIHATETVNGANEPRVRGSRRNGN